MCLAHRQTSRLPVPDEGTTVGRKLRVEPPDATPFMRRSVLMRRACRNHSSPAAAGSLTRAERGPSPRHTYRRSSQKCYGAFSPDGRWVAYRSGESGRSEIYIQGFPERRGKWQISAEGGPLPRWRADGNELYWNGLDARSVMAAPVDLQAAAVRSGRPELLFRPSFCRIRHDGKRFLVHAPEGGEQQALPMAVVTNWRRGWGSRRYRRRQLTTIA